MMNRFVKKFFIMIFILMILSIFVQKATSQIMGNVYIVKRGNQLVACAPREKPVTIGRGQSTCCYGVNLFYKFQKWDDDKKNWVYVSGHIPGDQGPGAGPYFENRWIHIGTFPDEEQCEIIEELDKLPPGLYKFIPLRAVISQIEKPVSLLRDEITFSIAR